MNMLVALDTHRRSAASEQADFMTDELGYVLILRPDAGEGFYYNEQEIDEQRRIRQTWQQTT
jgi:hypothetical protein